MSILTYANTLNTAIDLWKEAQNTDPQVQCYGPNCECGLDPATQFTPNVAKFVWASTGSGTTKHVPVCAKFGKERMDAGDAIWPLPGYHDIAPLSIRQYDRLTADIDDGGWYGDTDYASKVLNESGVYGVAILRVAIDTLMGKR